MTIWIDAQLSPALAKWIGKNFDVQAIAVRDLGLREATDRDIFRAARRAAVTVVTKDSDFARLLEAQGPPPKVILVTCGNTSNTYLKLILSRVLRDALALLESGETLVEISDF